MRPPLAAVASSGFTHNKEKIVDATIRKEKIFFVIKFKRLNLDTYLTRMNQL